MARQALLLERTADPKADAPVDADQRARAWQEQRELARRCRACPLFAHATQTVWGEGPIGAPLMLVDEQPGDQEDLQGRPFVGPAGRLLDRALAELGWDRSVAYVTNAVKHSGMTATDVELDNADPDRLLVRIESGPGDEVDGIPGGAQGLRGLRERVDALGGTLSTDHGTDGRFVIRAQLPVTT